MTRCASQCFTVKAPVASSRMEMPSPQVSQMMRPLPYSSVGDVLWVPASVSDMESARAGGLGREVGSAGGSFRFCGTVRETLRER